MKRYPSIILGAISACCLLSTHAIASEETAVEKHCCPPKCFTPIYATLIQSVPTPLGGSDPFITSQQFLVPFDNIQTAKGITFDETVAPDSFTLPKGVYCFKFQFSMAVESSTSPDITDERKFRFTDMYLDLNNDSLRIPLYWNTRIIPGIIGGFNEIYSASFSGSKIISIGSDNTVVKFIVVRDPGNLGAIQFAYDPYNPPNPLTTNNSPVRVNIHKIDGC